MKMDGRLVGLIDPMVDLKKKKEEEWKGMRNR
jgi:hypothetical protein